MRKFLLMLPILAAATAGAHASPAVAFPVAPAILADGIQAQPVQYFEDWRYREFRRREAYERFRRHEARREWRREHEFYGPRFGHGYGYGRY